MVRRQRPRRGRWLTNDAFGARCVFEANRPVLRRRPELDTQTFPELGVNLDVIWPGQPSGLYHTETNQEDFLVLMGECVLLIEGEERHLRHMGLRSLPTGNGARLRRRRRGPVRDFHDRPHGQSDQGHRVPALRARHATTAPASRPRRAHPPRPTRRSRTGSRTAPTAREPCPGSRRLRGSRLSPACREVFARAGRRVEVSGPALEDEAAAVDQGFW